VRSGAAYLAGMLALALASLAAADPPDRSPVPAPRPVAGTAPPAEAAEAEAVPQASAVARVVVTGTAQAPRASVRPPVRPAGAAPASPRTPVVSDAAPSQPPARIDRRGLVGGALRPRLEAQGAGLAVPRSLRPALRPDGLVQRVAAAATRQAPGRTSQPSNRGALCGVPGLVGDRLEPIAGRIQGCGIADPVRLRAVEGIALSTPATISCDAARALHTWVQGSLVPTVGRTGGGARSLRVVASYACRTRNNQPGARVSEHGRGNAIDIAGIGLANGTELTVLTGWRERRAGAMLRDLHRGACGPFGTVLGPNSDRFHQDHFHFDVASYRSGSYCR